MFLRNVLASLMIASQTATLALAGVSESRFGTMPDGRNVTQYLLSNSAGTEASIISLGATLQSLRVHDLTGHPIDVVLGYDSLDGYLDGRAFFGATIGRYASRIANAEFSLDGKLYHLPANSGQNTLHGGTVGFNRVVWNRVEPTNGGNAVRLTYVSVEGDQGFPGRLIASVTFTLTDANELKIAYEASTSAPTVINLTNHTYFNLGGAGVADVSTERLAVEADLYTPLNDAGIPTGEIKPVDNTDFDFRAAKSLDEHLKNALDAGVRNSQGYDINLILKRGSALREVALLQDPASGLSMHVLTTEPGLQLFTPYFPPAKVFGKSGRDYGGHSAICLETQHFPDSPHFKQFPTTVLRPGQLFYSETVYRFANDAR